MGDFGSQLKSGVGDAVGAVSSDVVKGLGQIAKDTAKATFETAVGGSANPVGGQQQGGDGGTARADELEALKQQKRAAEAKRIRELQEQLRSLMNKDQRAVAETKQREEEEKKRLVWEESEKKKRQEEAIANAAKGGGTAEIGKGSF